jgi:hypothetical protein
MNHPKWDWQLQEGHQSCQRFLPDLGDFVLLYSPKQKAGTGIYIHIYIYML